MTARTVSVAVSVPSSATSGAVLEGDAALGVVRRARQALHDADAPVRPEARAGDVDRLVVDQAGGRADRDGGVRQQRTGGVEADPEQGRALGRVARVGGQPTRVGRVTAVERAERRVEDRLHGVVEAEAPAGVGAGQHDVVGVAAVVAVAADAEREPGRARRREPCDLDVHDLAVDQAGARGGGHGRHRRSGGVGPDERHREQHDRCRCCGPPHLPAHSPHLSPW